MAQRDYFITDGDSERTYGVETLSDGSYRVTTPEGRQVSVDARAPEPGRMHLILDGARAYDVGARQGEDGEVIEIGAERHVFDLLNARQKRMRVAGVGGKGAGGPQLKSPMAGKVVAVNVAAGDEVEQGVCVVIVEAMKMENDLKAHLTGQIDRVEVAAGDTVEVGDVLLTITPAE